MTAEEILRALITEFDIEDYVYEIRDNECGGWDGPRVKRFGELMSEAREKLHENNRPTV